MKIEGYVSRWMFLYIDPLKQGLKHNIPEKLPSFVILFLYIDPLKQGLKLYSNSNTVRVCVSFYT